MNALPAWLELPPGGMSADRYDALSEDLCRRIEIVDGAVLVEPAPRRSDRRLARRLANLLESSCGSRHGVTTSVDLRLRDVPLLNRRPDVIVYDATLGDDVILRPEHCALVIEVMSPGSVTTDQLDKPAEYAAAGIEHFWRVEHTGDITLFRYVLDPARKTYTSAGVHDGSFTVTSPFTVAIDLESLL